MAFSVLKFYAAFLDLQYCFSATSSFYFAVAIESYEKKTVENSVVATDSLRNAVRLTSQFQLFNTHRSN